MLSQEAPMPNRPVHIATSTPAGAGYALYKAYDQNGLARILETAGGAFGGYLGGILPDSIDPPSHPGHCAFAHGFCPVVASTVVWNQDIDDWQNHFRQLADQHAYWRARSTDFAASAWHACAEWVFRLLSGFLAGIGAGYLTHVVLDSATPRCLPFVC